MPDCISHLTPLDIVPLPILHANIAAAFIRMNVNYLQLINIYAS